MHGSAAASLSSPNSTRLRKLRATVENALRNEMATTAVWYADKRVSRRAFEVGSLSVRKTRAPSQAGDAVVRRDRGRAAPGAEFLRERGLRARGARPRDARFSSAASGRRSLGTTVRGARRRKTYGVARQPVAQFERGVTSATAHPELRARLLAARCLARDAAPGRDLGVWCSFGTSAMDAPPRASFRRNAADTRIAWRRWSPRCR